MDLIRPEELPYWFKLLLYSVEKVGFPVFITAWFIVKLNGKVDAFVAAAQKISSAIALLTQAFAEHREWSKDAVNSLRDDVRRRR